MARCIGIELSATFRLLCVAEEVIVESEAKWKRKDRGVDGVSGAGVSIWGLFDSGGKVEFFSIHENSTIYDSKHLKPFTTVREGSSQQPITHRLSTTFPPNIRSKHNRGGLQNPPSPSSCISSIPWRSRLSFNLFRNDLWKPSERQRRRGGWSPFTLGFDLSSTGMQQQHG